MSRSFRRLYEVSRLSWLLSTSVLLLGIGCGSAARELDGQSSAPTAPSASVKALSAPPKTNPTAEPVPPPSPTAEAAPINSENQRLAALRSKALGEVAAGVGERDSSRVAMLRAICKRVVVHNNKQLGCEECVDCETDQRYEGLSIGTALVEALPGSFTRAGVEQALVVTTAATLEGYTRRYFLLERRDGRFWMVNTFRYHGRPDDVRLLKTKTGSNLVAMRMATPGAPPMSALRVWRLSERDVHSATLVPASVPFLTCRPSDLELADYVVRDKDNDKDDDITVQINDFASELEKEAVAQRLSQACDRGGDFRPPSKRLTFDFTFERDHFETSDAAAARLSLDGNKVEWSLQAWDLAAASKAGG